MFIHRNVGSVLRIIRNANSSFWDFASVQFKRVGERKCEAIATNGFVAVRINWEEPEADSSVPVAMTNAAAKRTSGPFSKLIGREDLNAIVSTMPVAASADAPVVSRFFALDESATETKVVAAKADGSGVETKSLEARTGRFPVLDRAYCHVKNHIVTRYDEKSKEYRLTREKPTEAEKKLGVEMFKSASYKFLMPIRDLREALQAVEKAIGSDVRDVEMRVPLSPHQPITIIGTNPATKINAEALVQRSVPEQTTGI